MILLAMVLACGGEPTGDTAAFAGARDSGVDPDTGDSGAGGETGGDASCVEVPVPPGTRVAGAPPRPARVCGRACVHVRALLVNVHARASLAYACSYVCASARVRAHVIFSS